MYERFTDRARKVMQLANQEAQRRNHEYIGTEHILLGIIMEGSGVAANVLKNLDVDLRKVRLEVEKLAQNGPDKVNMGKLPQTPRAKKVIEYAIEESQYLHHNYVGTEHFLLGLLREDKGVAAQTLMNLGLRVEHVRAEILAILGGTSNKEERGTYHPLPPIRWGGDETKGYVYRSDDETKNRARQLAEEIVALGSRTTTLRIEMAELKLPIVKGKSSHWPKKPLCPICGKNKVFEPHSMAILAAGAMLMDRAKDNAFRVRPPIPDRRKETRRRAAIFRDVGGQRRAFVQALMPRRG